MTFSQDEEQVEIQVYDTGERISFWTSYEFSSDFLTPSDTWSFATGDAPVVEACRKKLLPGSRISLVINDKVQCTGYVDGYSIKKGSQGGTVMNVKGRDRMGPVVDSCIDPMLSFSEQTTLDGLLADVIVQPFGFKYLATTNMGNRSVVTGVVKGSTKTATSQAVVRVAEFEVIGDKNVTSYKNKTVTFTTQYNPSKPKFLKDITLKQAKPHPGEGCYEFCARSCKRFGLWIWSDAKGETLICSEPDFDQEASGELFRNGTRSNIEDGEWVVDATNQPSVIIATGRGTGGAQTKGGLRVAMVNELAGLDDFGTMLPDVAAAIGRYKGIDVIPQRAALNLFAKSYRKFPHRALYLQDDESKTIEQLRGFVRKEMAIRQSRGSHYSCTVEGHTQNGKPWAVDTMVIVNDAFTGVDEPMYVKSRTFVKNESGTRTHLTLIRPNTMELAA